MYGTGGGLAGVTTGTALAATGFPYVGFTILGIVCVLLGLACIRAAVVRRGRFEEA